eukprot:325891-Prymnesium_polylepis.1
MASTPDEGRLFRMRPRSETGSDSGSEASDRAAEATGTTVEEALRAWTFYALWAAIFLHLTYGGFVSGHLVTLLRTGGGKSLATASSIVATQFACAIGGKFLSGVLLSLPAVPRTAIFVAAP